MLTDYEEEKDNEGRGPRASMDVLYQLPLVSTRCVYKCQSQTRRGWGNNKEYMTGTHPLPCDTVVQAQAWDRLKEDPVASEERWWCHCQAKYKTSWGALVEIFKDDVACYCLANLPPENMFDVKGMLIEQRFKHVKNATELYEAIPRVTPLARDAFVPIPGRQGMWKLLAMKELEERPKFDWNQLYNLGKTEAPMLEDTKMQVERLETRTM